MCVCVFFFKWEINCVIEKEEEEEEEGIWYDILVNVFNKFEGNIIINKIIIRFYINRSLKVNLYILYFLFFHFSSQPNKLVFHSFTFHSPNQTC